MPRGRQITIKTGLKRPSNKRGMKAEVNQEQVERIKAMLDQEEENIEKDLRREMTRMIDERQLAMSHELGDMNSKNKRLIMWIGVSLIMLVIVGFWVLSLDWSVERPYAESVKQIDPKSLSEYKDNLDKTFEEVMTQIDQLKVQSVQITSSSEPSLTTGTLPK
ncbi:MAG TPA: hypothetical protein PLJ58_01935 [bacterium]|nr:hypothetical protein [bacterium]